MSTKKIASMQIRNLDIYIPAVLSFIDSISIHHTNMDLKRYNRMRFVIAQVLSKRIKHSYPGGEGLLDIELFIKDNFFEFSIKDMGVPGWYDFSYDENEVTDNGKNLNNYIVDMWTDEIGIEKLGKNGQRVFIRQRIKNPIHFKAPQPYPETQVLDTNITIKPVVTEEDAIEAIRCIYSEYGYSYGYEKLYYIDNFMELIKSKQLMSFLAVNDHGQTAGHIALALSDTYKNMPEISTAVTRKEFRGMGLFSKLMSYSLETAKKLNCRAVMGQPVAFHPMSQKAFIKESFTPTSVLLSYLNVPTNNDAERLDLFACIKILDKTAQSVIYPPKELCPFIEKVYNKAGLGFEIIESSHVEETTEIKIEDNSILSIKKIILRQGGEDLEKILNRTVMDALRKKTEMIELTILLNSPSCSYCFNTAKKCNFLFSGVIPGGENSDYIIMQMLIGSEAKYNQLVTVGEFEDIKNDIVTLNDCGKDET